MRIKSFIAAATIAAFSTATMVGCTTNPYTGERQASKGATLGIIGGAVGAVIGAAVAKTPEERKKAALIGAGIGGVAGGSVGIYMDQQEAELRQQLEGTGVSVSREGDQIVLNMPGNVTFATDSSDVAPSFFDVLDSVVIVLDKYDSTLVNVDGHTDSTGSEEYNQKLSERRAASVAEYLLNSGIAVERLAAQGYGESRPIASNATPEGRSQNRRVEISLDPIEKQ
ncbi:OmpA family protein [Salinibius halmophilus]|uniref:OmpA family protein n=1 Tax=Salinibius halmophilus TaxID=1853216 RepID=UPI000E65F24C|nr:OmpA family protein [Salinibius halmophilus]